VDNSGSGGDFVSYFNPYQVKPVSPNTVNSLRVSILNSNFATVAQTYQKVINDGKVDLTMQSITIGANENITAAIGANNTEKASAYILSDEKSFAIIIQTDEINADEKDSAHLIISGSLKRPPLPGAYLKISLAPIPRKSATHCASVSSAVSAPKIPPTKDGIAILPPTCITNASIRGDESKNKEHLARRNAAKP
jgi:hypothetical protein